MTKPIHTVRRQGLSSRWASAHRGSHDALGPGSVLTTRRPGAIPLFLALALAALTFLVTGCAGDQRTAAPAANQVAPVKAAVPAQIAVLLPEAGQYAEAGAAVRAGILAAQGASGQGPEVRFYPSRDPAGVPELLRQAAANGASLAIGPLEKEAVDALAVQPALPIPTLALNQAAGESSPTNLYQFALDPEDEAADAARKAWASGYRSALLLYPASPWGERLANAFQREWVSRGGILVASHAFDPKVPDPASELLRESFAGSALTTPADCLFLVATAPQARSLWPRLLANVQVPPPIFSTSHVHEGVLDPEGNLALMGLTFVDIPWMIASDPADPLSRASLERASGGIDPRYVRLYAMGIDAYALVQHLEGLRMRPGAYLDGRTGRLSLDNRRRIQRELTLARMDSLGPVRVTGNGPAAIIQDGVQSSGGGGPRLAALNP